MAIQDSINSAIGSASQAVALGTGMKKLKESNEYAKSNAEIAKAQNEVHRIQLENDLSKTKGDIDNIIRKSTDYKDYNPVGEISEEETVNFLKEGIKSNEEWYDKAAKLHQATVTHGKSLNDELNGNKNPQTSFIYKDRPKGDIQHDIMQNGKWQKKALTDMDAANLATKTWKDKLTTMQTLRKQINILGMKDELEDKKGVK